MLTYRRVCSKPQHNDIVVFPLLFLCRTSDEQLMPDRQFSLPEQGPDKLLLSSVHVLFSMPTAKQPQGRQCFQFIKVNFVDDRNTKCYEYSS